jgi:O-acetyl-ADP-ribose deacetylase (regulator of RNase III)
MAPTFTLHLRDRNPDLITAWQGYFKSTPEVTVSQGDIFDASLLPSDAVISPANSFGFMDGGIDLVYSRFFGWDMQERLRSILRQEHDGELPVGQALVLPAEHPQITYLVSAPTMRVPMDIAGTTNVYLAFRAALRTVQQFNETAAVPIQKVLCPGFGTGYGQMPASRAALQMYEAFSSIVLRDQSWTETADGVHGHQRRLLR